MLDADKYNLLKGPYNRCNVYGALFSHGPFFNTSNLIKIRDEILYYAICKPGLIMDEFQLSDEIKDVNVDILYLPKYNEKVGSLYIDEIR